MNYCFAGNYTPVGQQRALLSLAKREIFPHRGTEKKHPIFEILQVTPIEFRSYKVR